MGHRAPTSNTQSNKGFGNRKTPKKGQQPMLKNATAASWAEAVSWGEAASSVWAEAAMRGIILSFTDSPKEWLRLRGVAKWLRNEIGQDTSEHNTSLIKAFGFGLPRHCHWVSASVRNRQLFMAASLMCTEQEFVRRVSAHGVIAGSFALHRYQLRMQLKTTADARLASELWAPDDIDVFVSGCRESPAPGKSINKLTPVTGSKFHDVLHLAETFLRNVYTRFGCRGNAVDIKTVIDSSDQDAYMQYMVDEDDGAECGDHTFAAAHDLLSDTIDEGFRPPKVRAAEELNQTLSALVGIQGHRRPYQIGRVAAVELAPDTTSCIHELCRGAAPFGYRPVFKVNVIEVLSNAALDVDGILSGFDMSPCMIAVEVDSSRHAVPRPVFHPFNDQIAQSIEQRNIILNDCCLGS